MKIRTLSHIAPATVAIGLFACSSSSSVTLATTPTTGTGTTTTVTSLPATPPVASGTNTAAVVAAANTFIGTLTATQKISVQFAFTDAAQKTRWSNFPTGIFSRAGVKIGSLNDAQRSALLALLATTFSSGGYTKVINMVNADEALRASGSGGNLVFGLAEYYVAFLGTPSVTTPWIIQFGGHHLAMNVPIVAEDMVLTPSLTGNQPATYVLNGATIRPLGGEVDKAFALMQSLSTAQQAQANLAVRVTDLVLGPGQDGKTIAAEGIRGSALSTSQQAALLSLIGEWVNINNDRNAAKKMAEIQATINDTYFAWSGATTTGSASYFRVTGPTLVLEFAPQNGSTDHVHAMYRDPTNDYGVKFIK